MTIAALFGVGQALVFAAALAGSRRGDLRSNRLLAALLTALAVLLAAGVVQASGRLLVWPHLAQIHVPVQLVLGPLIYLHVRSLLAPERRLARRDLAHAVPALACALYLIPFYAEDGAAKAAYLRGAIEHYPLEWRLRTACGLALGAGYLVRALVVVGLAPRRRAVPGAAGADLRWARGVVCVFGAIWLVAVVRVAADYHAGSNLVVPVLFAAAVNVAIYLRLRHAGAPAEPATAGPAATAAPAPPRKYERSTLTAERAERALRRLREAIEIDRVYLDSELTLAGLAEQLSLSPHHLSQLVNERIGTSFNDFINGHRIEEAKRRLRDPACAHFSILAIAETVGFAAKSSFNAIFKKHAGVTPSAWRNQVHAAETARPDL